MDGCQLEALPEAGQEQGPLEREVIQGTRRARSLAGRVVRLPVIMLDIVATAMRPPPESGPGIRRPPLHLQPGELARVRPIDEIRVTLDAHRRCAGLGFMPVMEAFCGRSFAVRKRIDRFFDERSRRMLRTRDIVVLEGVFCEAPLLSNVDYGGCDRSCFLFWKEDWLERVEPRT